MLDINNPRLLPLRSAVENIFILLFNAAAETLSSLGVIGNIGCHCGFFYGPLNSRWALATMERLHLIGGFGRGGRT